MAHCFTSQVSEGSSHSSLSSQQSVVAELAHNVWGRRTTEYGVLDPASLLISLTSLLVNLDSLSAQQLSQVKKQLDDEVEHLTSSFAQLQAAQGKFRECLRCVKSQSGVKGEMRCSMGCMIWTLLTITQEKKEILVPLTNSLYVRGNLSNPDHVLVDIGTGFFIEKVCGNTSANLAISFLLTGDLGCQERNAFL